MPEETNSLQSLWVCLRINLCQADATGGRLVLTQVTEGICAVILIEALLVVPKISNAWNLDSDSRCPLLPHTQMRSLGMCFKYMQPPMNSGHYRTVVPLPPLLDGLWWSGSAAKDKSPQWYSPSKRGSPMSAEGPWWNHSLISGMAQFWQDAAYDSCLPALSSTLHMRTLFISWSFAWNAVQQFLSRYGLPAKMCLQDTRHWNRWWQTYTWYQQTQHHTFKKQSGRRFVWDAVSWRFSLKTGPNIKGYKKKSGKRLWLENGPNITVSRKKSGRCFVSYGRRFPEGSGLTKQIQPFSKAKTRCGVSTHCLHAVPLAHVSFV